MQYGGQSMFLSLFSAAICADSHVHDHVSVFCVVMSPELLECSVLELGMQRRYLNFAKILCVRVRRMCMFGVGNLWLILPRAQRGGFKSAD